MATLGIEGAYDNISHGLLVDRLRQRVFDSSILAWISSFLSTRPLYTTDGVSTNRKHWLNKCAPQGSSLSPILFSLYIDNLLVKLNEQPGQRVKAHADDIPILTSSTSVTSEQLRKDWKTRERGETVIP